MASFAEERKNWYHLNDEEESRLDLLLSGGYLKNRRLFRYKDTKFTISENYFRIAERIRNFEVRSDDVWIMTFPKSGTNWTSEIAWQIENGVITDSNKGNLLMKTPFIERDMVSMDINGKNFSPFPFKPNELFNQMEAMKERRIIKTHLVLSIINPNVLDGSKVIYVARNPKDLCVSCFHFHEAQESFLGKVQQSFEDYAKCWKDGLDVYGDYWFHLNVSTVLPA